MSSIVTLVIIIFSSFPLFQVWFHYIYLNRHISPMVLKNYTAPYNKLDDHPRRSQIYDNLSQRLSRSVKLQDSIATNFASPCWLGYYNRACGFKVISFRRNLFNPSLVPFINWQAISGHIQTLGRKGILVGESSSSVAQCWPLKSKPSSLISLEFQ